MQGLSVSAFQTTPALKRYIEAVLDRAVEELIESGKIGKQAGFLARLDRKPELSDRQQSHIDSIAAILKREEFTPPLSGPLAEELSLSKQDVEKTLVIMERLGYAKRIGLDLFFDKECFDKAVQTIREALKESSGLSVSEFSKLLSSSP